MTDRIEGFHGRTDDRDPKSARDLYVADHDYAYEWANGGSGSLYKVSFPAHSALHVTSARQFSQAWHDSGAHQASGRFHPDTTSVFTDWARRQGHDAVVLHPSMFDTDDHKDWETAVGTFGDPQSIILKPHAAKVERLH